MIDVGVVLTRCFPNLKEWVCTDGTYKGLIWLPDATGPKPTQAELDAAWAAYVPPVVTSLDDQIDAATNLAQLKTVLKAVLKR